MEEITLEKIDLIRHRTGLSYAEAKNMLEVNNGNVVDTLIYIEQNQKSFGQNIADASNELIDTVKDIIKKGNVNRIKVKKDGKTIIDIPVTAAVVAGGLGIFYPILLAVGTITAVVSKITIEVERPDGKVDVVNDIVKNKADDVKEKAQGVVSEVKQGFNDVKQDITDTTGQIKNIINNNEGNINE